MPTRPESHDTAIKPRDAEAFAKCWKVPDKKTLIDGNNAFPNMFQRQDRLVGQVLNACVVLEAYTKINTNVVPNAVGYLFIGSSAEKDKAFREIKQMPKDKQLTTLVAMLENNTGPVRLRSHRDLVRGSRWVNYQAEFQQYRQDRDAYVKAQDISARNDERLELSAPTMPVDPRVTAINAHTTTIQIFNPGPKELRSIEGKLKRKALGDVGELRDINRIGVLPAKPEYAKNFIKIMELLTPEKAVSTEKESKVIPRIFEELPEVFKNGYYNQKLFIALDRTATQQTSKRGYADSDSITPDNTAALAEIKIVPAGMWQAENLSALIKPLIEEVSRAEIFNMQAKSNKGVESQWNALKHFYNAKQKTFDALVQKYNEQSVNTKFEYRLPPFPGKPSQTRDSTYTNLKQKLLDLATEIHVDGISRDNVEWQKEYLETALFQRMCLDQPLFKRNAERTLGKKIPRDDTLPNHWIKKVENRSGWKASSLEKGIREQYSSARNGLS